MVANDLVQVSTKGSYPVMRVFDPSGAIEITESHAPRLDTLEGKTICELSNDSWQAHRTFPEIRRLLLQRFPTARFVPYTEFPTGKEGIDTDRAAELVARAGAQAVLIGNAS